jgi:hypothetical protein
MNKPIKTILTELMPQLGFPRKKAQNWYRDKENLIHVVGLQKSNWGQLYYINLAVWVKSLGEPEQCPRVQDCHLRLRLEGIALHPNELEQALSEEDYWKMETDERQRVLKLEISNANFVYFNEVSSVDAIKRYIIEQAGSANLAVTRILKDALNLPL